MTPQELRHARKLLQLTQTELGEKLDMTCTSIGRMERGEQVIEKRTELAIRWLLRTAKTR